MSDVEKMSGYCNNVKLPSTSCPCVQVSAIVQRFYECLLHGKEYSDSCWEEWKNNHPAELAAKGGHQGGAAGTGRGNCFK